MKTRVILIVAFFSITFSSFGQYRMVEGEIGFGLPLYRSKLQDETNAIFAPSAIFGELRFNIPGSHFSPGVHIYIGGWEVNTSDNSTRKRNINAIMFVCDYNFNEIKNFIRPFTGFGIGNAQLFDGSLSTWTSGKFIISPRIGVEFWNRARLTLLYHITQKDYGSLNLNIGFVFGGGKIKEKIKE